VDLKKSEKNVIILFNIQNKDIEFLGQKDNWSDPERSTSTSSPDHNCSFRVGRGISVT